VLVLLGLSKTPKALGPVILRKLAEYGMIDLRPGSSAGSGLSCNSCKPVTCAGGRDRVSFRGGLGAGVAGRDGWSLRYFLRKRSARTMKAIRAKPPMAPPTIAPTLFEPEEAGLLPAAVCKGELSVVLDDASDDGWSVGKIERVDVAEDDADEEEEDDKEVLGMEDDDEEVIATCTVVEGCGVKVACAKRKSVVANGPQAM
jgi:hypothetical protein